MGSLASILIPVLVVPAGVVGLWALGSYLTGRHRVENAKYAVLRRVADSPRTELRRYAPALMAYVDVPFASEPDLQKAQSRGFRAIAGYIFGGNIAAGGASKEAVAMTSPVVTQAVRAAPASTTVAMTSPVLTSEVAGSGGADGGAAHRIAFIMPSRYSRLEELPRPTNPLVRLAALPSRLALAEMRFGARYPGAAARDEAEARLLAAAHREGLRVVAGSTSVFNYDPPWTLPFMRLSEVSLEVEDAAADDAARALGGGSAADPVVYAPPALSQSSNDDKAQ